MIRLSPLTTSLSASSISKTATTLLTRAFSTAPSTLEFLISKASIVDTKFLSPPSPELTANQIDVKIEKFAFTANNLTYANCGGPPLNYWNFFSNDDKSWGKIPVWGFGTVEKSNDEKVSEGERIYGYFPMAKNVILNTKRVNSSTITVSRDDPKLAPVYNMYNKASTDSWYSGLDCEDAMMIYRPLFITSFMLDDYCNLGGMDGTPFFDATQVILTSASSKTAFALAYMLKQRGVNVIGLTSKQNQDFVANLGLYTSVVTYDKITDIDATQKTIIVDMAGSNTVEVSLDKHLGLNLKKNIGVGLTHNTATTGREDLSQNARKVREFFFAPAWIQKRGGEDPKLITETAANQYSNFVKASNEKKWCEFNVFNGTEEVERVYRIFLDAKTVTPDKGFILSLHDKE